MTKNLENEGTVEVSLKHDHADWTTNKNGYNFGPFKVDETGISFSVQKTTEHRLHISITGPLGRTTTFDHQVPQLEQGKIHVAIV